MFSIFFLLCTAILQTDSAWADGSPGGWIAGGKTDPEFGESIKNVTVTAGREAILSCVVDNLGDFRVGWLKVDTQTILTIQKRVVTHNSRVAVTHDEHRTWYLHIRSVKEKDRGCYMCQINTPVMKNQVGCVQVHVSPDIDYEKTSSDTTVNEGDGASLHCTAEGYPTPNVTWRREDGHPIIQKNVLGARTKEKVSEVHGNSLNLTNVLRHQMGAYLCIAYNGVPPTVSKRITLNVNFAPMVRIQNQLLGAPLGTEVSIECLVQAYPHAVTYWKRDTTELLLRGRKYKVMEEKNLYNASIRLVIKNFHRTDVGLYECSATNSLGKSEQSIRLYVIEASSKTTTKLHRTPTPPTTHSLGGMDESRNEIEFRNSGEYVYNIHPDLEHQNGPLYGPNGLNSPTEDENKFQIVTDDENLSYFAEIMNFGRTKSGAEYSVFRVSIIWIVFMCTVVYNII